MRKLKKFTAAVLSAAVIAACVPALSPSEVYAAGSTDFASAAEAELNQLVIVPLEGEGSVRPGENDYVWYKFNAAPESKVELTINRLEGYGTVEWEVYDSSLKTLGKGENIGSREYSLGLGKDTTYYIRFYLLYKPSGKASFIVKGTNAAAPTEPADTPAVTPSEPADTPAVTPSEPADTPAKPADTPSKPAENPSIGNVDSDFWTEDENNGSSVYDDELPVPEIKEVSNSGKSVNIAWSCSSSSDIDGYYIYRSKDGTNWNRIAAIKDTEVDDYEDTDVANGESYGYILRSFVNDSQSENSMPEYTCFLNKVSMKSVKSNASKK